jgi:oxidoreductase
MLKVAFIGLGKAAKEIWVPSLLNTGDVEIIGGIDESDHSIENFSKHTGCTNLYNKTNIKLIIASDLVIISTPNVSHVDYSKICILNQCHVIIEKPVSINTIDWHILVLLSKQYNVKIFPSNAARYREDINKIKTIVDSGQLGEIRSVHAEWIRAKGIPGQNSWFTNKDLAMGGALLDLGWHLADGIFYIIGPQITTKAIYSINTDFIGDDKFTGNWKPKNKTNLKKESFILEEKSKSVVDDNGVCSFVTENNCHISIKAAWASHQKLDHTKIIISGNSGELELHTTLGFSENRSKKIKIIKRYAGNEKVDYIEYEKIGVEYEKLAKVIVESIKNNVKTTNQLYEETCSIVKLYEQIYNSRIVNM